MKNGALSFQGNVDKGIANYLDSNSVSISSLYKRNEKNIDKSHFEELEIIDDEGKNREEFGYQEEIFIKCNTFIKNEHIGAKISLQIRDQLERVLFTSEISIRDYIKSEGKLNFIIKIPGNILVPNSYRVQFAIHIPNVEFIELLQEVLQFTIIDTGTEFYMYGGADYGCVFVNCEWEKISESVLL